MTIAELTDTLADLCELDGTTEVLDAVEAQARSALAAGNGVVGAITAGSENGKSVSMMIQFTGAETLRAVLKVRRILNGTAIPAVVGQDYSRSLG